MPGKAICLAGMLRVLHNTALLGFVDQIRLSFCEYEVLIG